MYADESKETSRVFTAAEKAQLWDRWGEANLDRLIQNGKGDKSVTEARFRCRDCGEIVEKQVRPPVPSLGGSLAYI